MMNRIRVVDLCGPDCFDHDDGSKLFWANREKLDRGDSVLLDFSGVTTVGIQFLSCAIGGLYGYYPREEIEARLRWEGLHPVVERVVPIVQEKAILFFSATEEQQQALIEASNRLPGDEWND
jgi:hypothetical protein